MRIEWPIGVTDLPYFNLERPDILQRITSDPVVFFRAIIGYFAHNIPRPFDPNTSRT